MTNPSKLIELAALCEAATGPDAELNLAIADATGIWKKLPSWAPLNLTASLDAAMTLVPEGWSVKLWLHPDGECHAEVYKLGEAIELEDGSLVRPYASGGSPVEAGPVASGPLALCAAALRAQAAKEG